MQTIFSQISPGDVIAFSGNGIDSKIIQWFTRSPYSHVIVVLDRENTDQQSDNNILIAESTTYTTVPNFDERKCIKGVQVHRLSHWLDAYQACGKGWWFPLKQKLSPDNITQMQSWLWHHYKDETPFACYKSVVAGLTSNKYFNSEIKKESANSSTGFFCSELVTKALQIADVIECKVNPAFQTPKDLINFDCFKEPKLILPGLTSIINHDAKNGPLVKGRKYEQSFAQEVRQSANFRELCQRLGYSGIVQQYLLIIN